MDIMNYSSDLEIEKNFLSEEDFKEITDVVFHSTFPWLYLPGVANSEDNGLGCYYYVHNIGTENSYYDFMAPIYKKLNIDLANNTIQRIRANHYPRTDTVMKHGLHRDQDDHVKSLLLFLNTCDGYTYFKEPDRKIDSVANTAVHFDSFYMHHSTTTTTTNRRLSLQINYKLL